MNARKSRNLALVMAGALGALSCSADDERRVASKRSTERTPTAPIEVPTELMPLSEADTDAVRAVLDAFFAPTATAEERIELLEDGQTLADTITSLATLPGGMPYGPWGPPTVEVKGAVGETAVADVSLKYAGVESESITTENSVVIQEAELPALEVVKERGEWKLSKLSWCSIVYNVPGFATRCPASAWSLARYVEGPPTFAALDQGAGVPLVAAALVPEEETLEYHGGRIAGAITVPGAVGYYADEYPELIDGGGGPTGPADLVHYGADGAELSRQPLGDQVMSFKVDSTALPAALWIQLPDRLLRVDTSADRISASIPMDSRTPEAVISFLPLGDSVATVGVVRDDVSGTALIMKIVDLSGAELRRVTLLQVADKSYGSLPDAPIVETPVFERFTRDGSVDFLVFADRERIWMVDAATGEFRNVVLEDERAVRDLVAVGDRLLALTGTYWTSQSDVRASRIEELNVADGSIRSLLERENTECSSLAGGAGRKLWLECSAPQLVKGAADESDYWSQNPMERYVVFPTPRNLAIRVDISTGTILGSVVLGGALGYSRPVPSQLDGSLLLINYSVDAAVTKFTLPMEP